MTCPDRFSSFYHRWLVLSCTATFLSVVLVLSTPAAAMQSIAGTVFDSTAGTPVEGAEVRLEGTGITAVTDARGCFVIERVPSGQWRLSVSRIGYRLAEPVTVDIYEGYDRRHHLLLVPAPIVLPPHHIESEAAHIADETAVQRYTREEFRRAGHRSVAEALDAIPGVRVVGSSDTPGGTRVSVGGEDPKRVAVLLDGLPLASGADGAVSLDPIPFSAVSAVEVQSGSHSAAAGDAAVGGVVNLITRTDSPASGHTIEGHGGSFGQYRGSVTARRSLRGLSGRAIYEHFGQGDEFSYPDADTGARRRGVRAQGDRAFLGLSSSKSSTWNTSAFMFGQEAGVPGALKQLTPGATNDRDQMRVQSQYRIDLSPVRIETALWYESSRERYESPQFFRTDSEFRERFFGSRLRVEAATAALRMTAEFEARKRRLEGKDRIRPDSSFGIHRRTEGAMRGLTRYRYSLLGLDGRLATSAAVDVDDFSKPVVSPRVDAGIGIPLGMNLRAGWGRSFRRPALTSLFWKSDVFASGNPDLRPERASEWDVSLRYARGPLTVETRYYDRRVEDIIVWERDFTGKYKPQNIPTSTTVGREDHIALRLFGRSVSLDYNHVFQDARDRSGEVNHDGHMLVLTPRHTHDLELNLKRGRFSGRLHGRWVSVRYTRRMNDRGKTLPAYRTFDGFVRFTVLQSSPHLTVSIHLDNITNERIELLERYPLPGRAFSLATTVEF